MVALREPLTTDTRPFPQEYFPRMTIVIRVRDDSVALIGVGSLDPAGVGAVSIVLRAATFAALSLPAQWASRVEPPETGRKE
jgi:hypothetical protein